MTGWRMVGLLACASLVVALLIGSDPTASAATKKAPATGSSCAHPWKMTFNPSKIDPVYGKGAQKVISRIKIKTGSPAAGFGTASFTASLRRSDVRVCHFTGRMTSKPADKLSCNHSKFSPSGWDITNRTGGTCEVTVETRTGTSGGMTMTVTAARKRSS